MVILITLGILLTISWYVIYNLFTKVELGEDIIESQNEYITKIQEAINFSNNKIKEIDEKGVFKSDDEIGWFFENIKYIQEIINKFYINNSTNE